MIEKIIQSVPILGVPHGKVLKSDDRGVPYWDDPCECSMEKVRCPKCAQVLDAIKKDFE
jgi:hypothetical protein